MWARPSCIVTNCIAAACGLIFSVCPVLKGGAACRNKDSWLDIRLHCTGSMTRTKSGAVDKDSPTLKALNSQGDGATTQEGHISLENTVKASGKKFPPMERPEVKLASPFFLKPR